METCEHATTDQRIIRDEEGDIHTIWCGACGDELF
jgi:hypothetical protein